MDDEYQPDLARVARLERLLEITSSLNSTLSLRPLLNSIVGVAKDLTQTEACSILLLDRKSGKLYFESATNLPGIRSVVVPMEGSIAGWVVEHGQALVVPNVQQDGRFYRQADEQTDFETRSILAVPLITRGNVLGVLEAVNKLAGQPFSGEDVELLTVLGNQAAVAVQNALLFQQTDLVSEIVHEMRTPLMSIVGYADLIRKSGVTDEQRVQFAEIIRAEAERLTDLADGFLDLARFESGRASLVMAPVDLRTVVQMAVSVVMPQADQKQIGVSVDIPVHLPVVTGDAQRLHQVLLNLLGNAIKYSRLGDNVTVSVEPQDEQVCVRVADTGPGIAPQDLPHIFERFYRVPSKQADAPGTGLGLTVAQQIVEAHHGEIDVESTLGEGTTFRFTLPV